jgi:large exoprotein involved in heme utilization and adhesion
MTLKPGLQYGATPLEDVSNDGTLAVDPGESLVLLGDTVTNTGTLTAPGGQVQLLGNRVGLFGAGRIDVSSPTGGGTVNLGGDFQGQGTLPTAQQTVVGPDATLLADATASGDGGTIIVWADGLTRFYGTASTQGGSIDGNGGLVEVSGLGNLIFEGTVNTLAVNGEAGTLWLDPTNIQVVPDGIAETFALADVDEFEDPDIGGDDDTRLAASTITGAAATSNIILHATQDIHFTTALTIANPGITLTATADNDILVSADILFANGGNITFAAGNNISVDGASIRANSGNIRLTAGNILRLENNALVDTDDFSALTSDSGNLTINTRGVELLDNSLLSASTSGSGDGGLLEINAADFVELNSDSRITSQTNSGTGNAGDVSIFTGQVLVSDRAQISIATFGDGNGGSLTINARDFVQLTGNGADLRTGLFSQANPGSSGNAGDILITTEQLIAENGAQVSTATFGPGNGGMLIVNATDLIQLTGSRTRFTSLTNPGSSGNAGEIQLFTSRLLVEDGANISTGTFGPGDGNSLTINATDFVRLTSSGSGVSSLSSQANPGSTGNAGDIQISTGQFLLEDRAQVGTATSGTGNGGTLIINAREVVRLAGNGAQVTGLFSQAAPGSSGNAGDIQISTEQFWVEEGKISARTLGSGSAGDIEIDANRLEMTGFISVISTSSNSPNISSGAIDIEATDVILEDQASIESIGSSGQIQMRVDNALDLTTNSGIVIESLLGGTPGSIFLQVGELNLREQSTISAGLDSFPGAPIDDLGISSGGDIQVLASTIDLENQSSIISTGGQIEIDTDRVALNSGSGIFTTSFLGEGGEVLLRADESLTLDNQSNISAATGLLEGDGEGGNISLVSPNITLGNQSFMTASSGQGDGGNIEIQASNFLLLRNNSSISASAGTFGGGPGGGGNIDIGASFVVGVLSENSDIVAVAVTGDGGRVTINAFDIIGLEFQDSLTPFSDITATSDFGNAGITVLNRLTDVNVEEGLSELPLDLTDPTRLISQQCQLQATDRASEFTVDVP